MCEFYWMADRLSNLFKNWEKPQINNRTCRATEERLMRKMSLEESCQKGKSSPPPPPHPRPKEGLLPCVPGRPPSSAWMLPTTGLSPPSQNHRSLESSFTSSPTPTPWLQLWLQSHTDGEQSLFHIKNFPNSSEFSPKPIHPALNSAWHVHTQ